MKNKPLTSPPLAPPAPRAKVDRFLKGLQRFRAKGDHPLDEDEVEKYDRAGVEAYLGKMTVELQQAIARRILMDIMKAPPAKGEEPKRKRKPTKKKKTASKAKSKRAPKKKRSPAKKAGRRR